MDIQTVSMPIGMTKRKLQQMAALMVALMMLLSQAAHAVTPATGLGDLGERVSIIVSKLNPNDTRPERAVERFGGVVGAPLAIVDGFEAKVPEGAVAKLANDPSIRGIVNNAPVRMSAAYGENSGVASAMYAEVTRANKAWGTGITGKGIGVAIIDTGVSNTGDLKGRIAAAADFSGENQPYVDSYGHGTFVAGLIAGNGSGSNGTIKGVAPEAHIFSVKIAGRDGSTNIFRLLAALEFVTVHKDAFGIRVLNLSLGTDSAQSYKVDPLNFAVERVWNSGIVVVAAAGNKGKIVKPADDPLVVTVGAADDKTTLIRSDDVMAGFSGVGPTADGIAKPDVVASGRSVVSSRSVGSTIEANFPNAVIGDRYFKGSGTSFSSAVVAGAAALVVQKSWNLNPNQVKHRLVSTAKPLSATSSNAQGAGSIDAYNAVISTDLTAANQGVVTSNASGSLQASSGSGCYRDASGACASDADVNAAFGFEPAKYFGTTWAGTTWNGTTWTGTTWADSQWNGTTWTGTTWAGTTWYGDVWNGTTWTGTTWNGTTWTGTTWAGTTWTGTTWNGTTWAGTTWTDSQWAGTTWTGTTWGGTTWGGTTWGGTTWGGTTWGGLDWLGTHWN